MAASSVDLPATFERHLRAENKSACTVETCPEAVLQLQGFLAAHATWTWPSPPARTWRRSPPPPPTATGPAGLLRLAGGRGRDPHRPDGQDEAAEGARAGRPGAARGPAAPAAGRQRRPGFEAHRDCALILGREAGIDNLHAPLVSPYLRPPVAAPGRRRDRPDAAGGLEVPGDAATLRRLGGRRAGPRGPPAPLAWRPGYRTLSGSPVGLHVTLGHPG
jgi:hypothetical protein